MPITKCGKFKGEITNYLRNGQNNFDCRIDGAFSSLRFKTWLSRSDISKEKGYPASHLLFVLFLLPVLKLKSVHSFCNKNWYQWSCGRKDSFYRFKQKPYRWRSFFLRIIVDISRQLQFGKRPLKQRYFVIDDSVIPKRGKHIENVSFIYDHCSGRSVLGHNVVKLGLFTDNGYYPVDFSYWFSAKRHPKSSPEAIGDPRSISGRMSFEAKHYSRPELALAMIKRAFDNEINAGYVLFDSWYAWPSLINKILAIKNGPHVICRLKDTLTQYTYNGKKYRLSELYQKVKNDFKNNKRTGLLLKRITVTIPGNTSRSVIIFTKGYCQPQADTVEGRKKSKQPKWVAFLSTDTRLHADTIIKKYTKRWAAEVCFKESKQLLALGKDQSNNFQAQVFATTLSFLRYALLSYLNEREKQPCPGRLFDQLVDDTATLTYAKRIWDFFRGIFKISFSKIFELFEIEEHFQSYFDALDQAISESPPFRVCET